MFTELLFLVFSQLLLVSCGLVNRNLPLEPELPPGSNSDPAKNLASIYNPSNLTCNGLNGLNSSSQWQVAGGDTLWNTFTSFWTQNKMVCKDCFGQDKQSCRSLNSPDCQKGGLQDQAKRLDKAAAIFSGNSFASDFQCSLPANGCNAPLTCSQYINGPGIYLLMKSLSSLSNVLQNSVDQINQASDSLQPEVRSTSDPFATTFAPKWRHEVAETTFAAWLNSTTHDLQQAYVNASIAFFANGADYIISETGSYTTVSVANLLKSGALITPAPAPNNVPNFSKVLLQQLVLSTWAYVAKDQLFHIPYIAFDNVACPEVKRRDIGSPAIQPRLAGTLVTYPPLKNINAANNGITIDGKCYYLLDAVPGGHKSNTCVGTSAPAGATNSTLDKEAKQLGGLDTADWLVPAVKGFLDNNHNNTYYSGLQGGQLLEDPLTAAAVAIPVCDFVGNPDAPGHWCPQVGKKVVMNGKVKTCARY